MAVKLPVHVAFITLLISASCTVKKEQKANVRDVYKAEGYHLTWADEFNRSGKPDAANWTYERALSEMKSCNGTSQKMPSVKMEC
jgi:hypothetical protein